MVDIIQNEEIIFKENDRLFYRIAKSLFKPDFDFDDIPPVAFTPVGNALSTNWNRFCETPQDCLMFPSPRYLQGRTTDTHGVGHFLYFEVIEIPNIEVSYSPSIDNKSHTDILGIMPDSGLVMRKTLKRIFKSWDLKPTM